MPTIESLLEEARKRLVETGTRNRLIHVNRRAKRGNFLNIINERSDDIFQILRLDGKKMRFAGKGQEEDDNDSNGIVLTEINDEEFDASRYTDSILETPLTPDALQKRLLRLARDARTAEEEQGINILFLATGFLRWYEDAKSDVLREAPLILLPVELVRNIKTSTYDIKCRDDDIVANLPLQERMKLDFGISIPEIDDSQDWKPADYFNTVSKSISGKERWEIDPDGMQLGFFSFAKLMMLHDLDPDNWDEKSLVANELISRLLADGFESEPLLFKEDDNLDEALSPEQILHVVDADSSQTKVIEEVRSGKNIVVQGPPGTGKSQTITNILAAAAHDNKKVLFVAEKMAALEVVYNRMCKVGLKDLCLELHSKSANKKVFLFELAETISNGQRLQPTEVDVSALKRVRDELNKVAQILHTPIPKREYTPHAVLSSLVAFIGKNTHAPRFDASAIEPISQSQESQLFEKLNTYLDIVREHGSGKKNPFFGSKNLDLQPTDLQRLSDELENALEALGKWTEFQKDLEEQLISEPVLTLSSALNCKSIYVNLQKAPKETSRFISIVHKNFENPRFLDALHIGEEWVSHKEQMSPAVGELAWNQDLSHLRTPLLKGVGSWVFRIFGKYRAASNELNSYLKEEIPKRPSDRLQILDSLIEGRSKKKALDNESDYLKRVLGEEWRGDQTSFSQFLSVRNWLDETSKELLKFSADKLIGLISNKTTTSFDSKTFDNKKEMLLSTFKSVSERLELEDFSEESVTNISLADLQNQLHGMLNGIEKYSIWTQQEFAKQSLLKFPVDKLLEMLDQEKLTLDDASNELRYALSEARWNFARTAQPKLSKLARLDRHELVKSFMELERKRISEVQQFIRDNHLAQIPLGTAGEMGIIRGEIAKTRNHRPIRQLMKHVSGVIQRLKPIFLMSPISIAQFLPPGKVEFDLLVIDEASQVRPQDALGSIARAKQIVVVGDQKQLPPTSFFDRLTDNIDHSADDDEADDGLIGTRATEMESILSLCEARGLTQTMLEWHYRSRDPSLITVSNVEFYKNKLILPPCPTQADEKLGLSLVQVPGVYSSTTKGGGRPRTNRIEAEAVVNRLREWVVSRPDFSVGIVTFSKSQADMVTEVLEYYRREDEILDIFLREGKFEDLFVKNIENVQGDERDIILISVGYGPHGPNKRLPSMGFGPINSEGGERRLNVLFSRSRIACEVFTSFDPVDIDLSRTSKEGPVVLKKFLEYAKTGVLPETYTSEGSADSPFEEDVADVIRGLGYPVEHQVGTAGFRIDLGVKDPNKPDHYILAVECDGASYHGALWARERDRLRQEVLEGFGWCFHRIWSTDWFYKRDQEVWRLKNTLENARERDLFQSLKGSNEIPASQPPKDKQKLELGSIVLKDPEIRAPQYKRASIIFGANHEPHKRLPQQVVEIVCDIVKVEGPVHIDEIARRYTSAHGKSRVGSKISAQVANGLARAEREDRLVRRGKFWGTKEQFENVPVRDRSLEIAPTASTENICPEEIIACAALIEKECGIVDLDEMIRVIAKTLGFKRAGPEFQNLVRDTIGR